MRAKYPRRSVSGSFKTYDEKPRRRLWELMKSQGMQDNQQVVFMSDGGENVRRVQEYLHPFSEHLIDWFHRAADGVAAADKGLAGGAATDRR
jgi:arylsulfatase A-like enzyme